MRLTYTRNIVICAAILLLGGPAFVSRAEDKDEKKDAGAEQAVRDWAKEMSAAWEKHDGKAVAALYAEDGDLTTPQGEAIAGREAIERHHADLFDGVLKDTKLALEVRRIKFVTPQVAVLDTDGEISGGKGDDGNERAALSFRLTAVLVRHGDSWLASALRPIIKDQ
jgi:uncharacterized protein (TIGR02246 family)